MLGRRIAEMFEGLLAALDLIAEGFLTGYNCYLVGTAVENSVAA